jgi:hypothetical protein
MADVASWRNSPVRVLAQPHNSDVSDGAIQGADTRYYVNKNAQANGDHEVHTSECSFVPAADNRLYLGDYTSCGPAVTEARKTYRQSNGCYYCSRACHTS